MFLGFGITGGGTLLPLLAVGEEEHDDEDAIRVDVAAGASL